MRKGNFIKQPYFTDNEIETICTEKLRTHGYLPDSPTEIRIDRFIEKCFNVVPQYEELPGGVLGYTQFGPNGVEQIYVSRKLDEKGDRVSERRIRTTLAHEAGHGFLHLQLFKFKQTAESLFPEELNLEQKKILCRDEITDKPNNPKRKGYDGRWWEFQANRAMASLLLPRSLVLNAAAPFLSKEGLLEITIMKDAKRDEFEKVLSDIFNVNPVVSRIRINQLFPSASNNQLTL